jgi:catechol 2,3-dioxygenase-like lactoylglutathione lyase family enzyme
MIEGMEHVGLSVSNLERSIDFYCKNFNFELLRILKGSEILGKVVGMPGCVVRIAHLKFGNSALELFEYTVPDGKLIPKDRKQADKGFNHLGFRSSDVRKDYERLKNEEVNFISEPIEFRKNVWLCYFYGPDGEVGEIRESEQLLTDKWE